MNVEMLQLPCEADISSVGGHPDVVDRIRTINSRCRPIPKVSDAAELLAYYYVVVVHILVSRSL